MSSQENSEENLPTKQDSAHGAVAVADNPFADPGLPPHEARQQDLDDRTAKRSERTVALLFTVSMLALSDWTIGEFRCKTGMKNL